MDSLYQKMQKCAVIKGDNTAIVFYGKRYSFKKILSLVDRAAAGLKEFGVQKGSVVTLCMPNTPSAQIAFYALNRLGAVVSLVHPYISASQLNQSMKHTKSSVLIAFDLFLSSKGAQINTCYKIDSFSKNKADSLSNYVDALDEVKKNVLNGDGDYLDKNKDNFLDGNMDAADKKGEYIQKIRILKSNSDYFMSGAAKLYYKMINRKSKPFACKTFESLFLNESMCDAPVDFGENQPAVYLPSGGTTGTSKTIMHSCMVFNKLCSHAEFFLSRPIAEYKAMYSVLPIFHGFGLCMNMHMCATIGIKNVMSIKFNPSAMAKAIKKEGINVITGVPAMYQKLLACKDFLKADLSPVYDCFVGGDSAGVRLIDEFNAVLAAGKSGAKLYEGYGLTETVTVCTVGNKNYNRAGSVGYPLPDTKLRIVKDGREALAGEVGEICINTPLLMLGYLGETPNDSLFDGNGVEVNVDTVFNKNPAQTDVAAKGTYAEVCENPVKIIDGQKWLFSGDLGYVDGDGFLFFKQRAKSMIKVSGIPVFPSEIEAVAESISGVIRAAAIGIDDSVSGQVVKLIVQSTLADHQALKDSILTECKQKLIPYALPKIIEIRDTLPLNTIGKIDRKKL